MPKLTETLARTAKPHKTYWDDDIGGFGLVCGKKAKTWTFQRDIKAKTFKTRIGRYPLITAQTARQTALKLALDHATGAGVVREIEKVPTLREALEDYLLRMRLRSEQNRKQTRARVHTHLRDWLDRPLNEVTRKMCVDRHQKLFRIGPTGANHVMQTFRTIYNYAGKTIDLPTVPTTAIEYYKEEKSQPIIDDLDSWYRQICRLSPIQKSFYSLLLLTGFRKSEGLKLKWEQVRDDHIYLPMTKNGRPFSLPIKQVHHEIIAPMRGLSDEYVFPSTGGSLGHMTEPARIGWSPHAHRRTFATVAQADAGLFEETVGRLLNHTPQTITGAAYVKYDYTRLAGPMNDVIEAFKRSIPLLFQAECV